MTERKLPDRGGRRSQLAHVVSELLESNGLRWPLAELPWDIHTVARMIQRELEDSERDRNALAEADDLIRKHLEAMGPCDNCESDDEFCDISDCTYCAIARSRFGHYRKDPADD